MASSTATDNEHFVDEMYKEISYEDQVACGEVTGINGFVENQTLLSRCCAIIEA